MAKAQGPQLGEASLNEPVITLFEGKSGPIFDSKWRMQIPGQDVERTEITLDCTDYDYDKFNEPDAVNSLEVSHSGNKNVLLRFAQLAGLAALAAIAGCTGDLDDGHVHGHNPGVGGDHHPNSSGDGRLATMHAPLSLDDLSHLTPANDVASGVFYDSKMNQSSIDGNELLVFGNTGNDQNYYDSGFYIDLKSKDSLKDAANRKKILGLPQGQGSYTSLAIYKDKDGANKIVFTNSFGISSMDIHYNPAGVLEAFGQPAPVAISTLAGFSYVQTGGVPHLIVLGNKPYMYNLHTNETTEIPLKSANYATATCGLPSFGPTGPVLLSVKSVNGDCKLAKDPTLADLANGVSLMFKQNGENDTITDPCVLQGVSGDKIVVLVNKLNLETGNLEPFPVYYDVSEYCGDKICGADETSATCETDCPKPGPVCGDGTCDAPTEDSNNCAKDCPPVIVEDAGSTEDLGTPVDDPGTQTDDTNIIIADSDGAGVNDIPAPEDTNFTDVQTPIDADKPPETAAPETTPPPDATPPEYTTTSPNLEITGGCTIKDWPKVLEQLTGEHIQISGESGMICEATVHIKGFPNPAKIQLSNKNGKFTLTCDLFQDVTIEPLCEASDNTITLIDEHGEKIGVVYMGTVTSSTASNFMHNALGKNAKGEFQFELANYNPPGPNGEPGEIVHVDMGPNHVGFDVPANGKINRVNIAQGTIEEIQDIPPVPDGTPQADIQVQYADGGPNSELGADLTGKQGDATSTPNAPSSSGGCIMLETPAGNAANSEREAVIAVLMLLIMTHLRSKTLQEQPATPQSTMDLVRAKVTSFVSFLTGWARK